MATEFYSCPRVMKIHQRCFKSYSKYFLLLLMDIIVLPIRTVLGQMITEKQPQSSLKKLIESISEFI